MGASSPSLLTLKAETTIPRDQEGENHLMVEGLTEHVLIAAMYATASASRLWEDRPSPPLAQAAQDAPYTGPTAKDIDQILSTRAPPKKGNKYHAHWQPGVPLYHKTSVTVHAHNDLRVDGRLGAYECVGPGWQLNVLLTHIPFGEETKDFLEALSLAYRRLSLLAPTIIIGDRSGRRRWGRRWGRL